MLWHEHTDALRGQKGLSDPLELECGELPSMDAGIQNQVLGKVENSWAFSLEPTPNNSRIFRTGSLLPPTRELLGAFLHPNQWHTGRPEDSCSQIEKLIHLSKFLPQKRV